MSTLQLRVERASSTALRLARLAADHPATAQVNYPGLPESAGHDVARRLTDGRYGGMFSFTLANAHSKAAVYDAFELIVRAPSLGDVVSLVDSSVNPNVLRISVGIEDPDDLAADLTHALDSALSRKRWSAARRTAVIRHRTAASSPLSSIIEQGSSVKRCIASAAS